jgi:hypothetical protein
LPAHTSPFEIQIEFMWYAYARATDTGEPVPAALSATTVKPELFVAGIATVIPSHS